MSPLTKTQKYALGSRHLHRQRHSVLVMKDLYDEGRTVRQRPLLSSAFGILSFWWPLNFQLDATDQSENNKKLEEEQGFLEYLGVFSLIQWAQVYILLLQSDIMHDCLCSWSIYSLWGFFFFKFIKIDLLTFSFYLNNLSRRSTA